MSKHESETATPFGDTKYSSNETKLSIFVPGRVCLFGEHSDWAAGYRSVDPNVECGYAIIVGTNQGIYAHVTKRDLPSGDTTSILRYKTKRRNSIIHSPLPLPMNEFGGETTDKDNSLNSVEQELQCEYHLIFDDTLFKEATFHDIESAHHMNNDSNHDDNNEILLNENKDMKKVKDMKKSYHGQYFSYIAGVIYETLKLHQDKIPQKGVEIEIENYKTDLPIKKGLSSSAAICVLIVRALNQIFQLNLSTVEEMDIAYRGEILTGSKCGRLDQGCAFGHVPIMMRFDETSNVHIEKIKIPKALHFVIVDLHASKDTKKILKDLNVAFEKMCSISNDILPSSLEKQYTNAQRCLGELNKKTVWEAKSALESGNAKLLGELMNKAQANFDQFLQPLCPSELTAPILHQVLGYSKIQQYIYGGKGIGSGGDGCAQLIARDKTGQQMLMKILHSDFGYTCIPLDLISPIPPST